MKKMEMGMPMHKGKMMMDGIMKMPNSGGKCKYAPMRLVQNKLKK